MDIKSLLPVIASTIAIIGSLAGGFIWANDKFANLATKSDVIAAQQQGELKSIDIQLSFNDYRLREIEDALKIAGRTLTDDIEKQRIYNSIIRNSERLEERRMSLQDSQGLQE